MIRAALHKGAASSSKGRAGQRPSMVPISRARRPLTYGKSG